MKRQKFQITQNELLNGRHFITFAVFCYHFHTRPSYCLRFVSFLQFLLLAGISLDSFLPAAAVIIAIANVSKKRLSLFGATIK